MIRVPALNPIKVGDEFFEPLNIRFSHRWRDVGIFFCFFGMSAWCVSSVFVPDFAVL
jgi:hypothetical protein